MVSGGADFPFLQRWVSRMLENLNDRRALLERARTELIENENSLATLAEAKGEASKAGREAFAQWKDDSDWRTMEKDRLTVLIEELSREVANEDAAEASARLRETYKRRRAANGELANRIVNELSRINSETLALLREIATAAIEDVTINAALPDDLEPLVSAHVLARAHPGRARQELSSKRLSLWVRSDNGAVVGDPDAVEDVGNGRGVIRRMAPLPNIRCHKASFEQISFHPAEAPIRPIALWKMRLADAKGPGFIFDGSELTHPSQVLAALDRAAQIGEPRDRPIETEVRPLGPDKR